MVANSALPGPLPEQRITQILKAASGIPNHQALSTTAYRHRLRTTGFSPCSVARWGTCGLLSGPLQRWFSPEQASKQARDDAFWLFVCHLPNFGFRREKVIPDLALERPNAQRSTESRTLGPTFLHPTPGSGGEGARAGSAGEGSFAPGLLLIFFGPAASGAHCEFGDCLAWSRAFRPLFRLRVVGSSGFES